MTTELASSPDEETVRTLGVLDANGRKNHVNMKNTHCSRPLLSYHFLRTILLAGVPKQDAQVALKGTTSGDKNELLFSRFGINYNDTPRRFRKGTTLYRSRPTAVALPEPPGSLTHRAPKEGPRTDDCASVDADGTGGSVPERRTNGKGLVAASANEKKQVVASANEQTTVLTSANEKDPAEASANEMEPPVLASANEKTKPVVASPSPAKEPALVASSCAGSLPELSGVDHAAGTTGGAAQDDGPLSGGSQNALDKVKTPADEVVRVVTSGVGMVKLKRLLKKGHAPPGTIEEDACDLIRTEFWGKNPHILSGIARR